MASRTRPDRVSSDARNGDPSTRSDTARTRARTDEERPTGASPPRDARGRKSRRSSRGTERYGRAVFSLSGLLLLTAAKAADAVTTGIGLLYVPNIYEANPIVQTVFERTGVVEGLLVSSFAVVAGIVLVTEVASLAVAQRRRDGYLAPIVRLTGYGLPTMLFAAVALRNVDVLLRALRVTGVP